MQRQAIPFPRNCATQQPSVYHHRRRFARHMAKFILHGHLGFSHFWRLIEENGDTVEREAAKLADEYAMLHTESVYTLRLIIRWKNDGLK